MNNDVFNAQDMFHMFKLSVLEGSVCYLENVISYPDEFVGFVKETGFVNTQTEDSGNIRLDQKIKYIKNSLTMAIELSLPHYAHQQMMPLDSYRIDYSSIPVLTISTGESVETSLKQHKKSLVGLIFLNDDYVGGEVSFPNHNIRFKPKSGSLLFFSDKSEYKIDPVVAGISYVSWASIEKVRAYD